MKSFFFWIALGVPLVAQDVVVRYEFDEGSGTRATDSSGNGFHGTIAGASYVPGVRGTALRFRGGREDAVTIPREVFAKLGGTEKKLGAVVRRRLG